MYDGPMGFMDGDNSYINPIRMPINERQELFISKAVWDEFYSLVKDRGMETDDVICRLMLKYIEDNEIGEEGKPELA